MPESTKSRECISAKKLFRQQIFFEELAAEHLLQPERDDEQSAGV
jgi:hypothetical protein